MKRLWTLEDIKGFIKRYAPKVEVPHVYRHLIDIKVNNGYLELVAYNHWDDTQCGSLDDAINMILQEGPIIHVSGNETDLGNNNHYTGITVNEDGSKLMLSYIDAYGALHTDEMDTLTPELINWDVEELI